MHKSFKMDSHLYELIYGCIGRVVCDQESHVFVGDFHRCWAIHSSHFHIKFAQILKSEKLLGKKGETKRFSFVKFHCQWSAYTFKSF